MYAFDSDSEPEQNFKLGKVAEEDQPHVKEILEKGRKILPNYDDQALYGLYKRYYSIEHIFINELNMIARRLKGEQEGEEGKRKDDKWINVGREIKTKVNKSNYNFLEDKELIRRAQQYLKNKTLLPERRPNFTNDQRRQNNGPKDTRPRNEQPNNQAYREQKPKPKFVEKVEDKKVQNAQEQKPVVETVKKVESSPVKEQKFKEKLEVPTTQPKVQQPKVEEKKPVPQEKPAIQPQKTQEASKKEEPAKQTKPAPKQKYVESKPTEQKPVEQKPVPKPQPVVQTPKPVTQAPQQPVKETQNIPSTHNIPTVQNFDPVLAAKNFELACSQNSFVLKFIQPQAYPQRISYIRTQDGGMKNVQIRVTGTSTSGSQKAL